MKAFVDGNMIALVNNDFIDLQQSDVVWVERGVKGRDQLGKCLMEVRQEIRNGVLNE